jgi:hypothetical protein
LVNDLHNVLQSLSGNTAGNGISRAGRRNRRRNRSRGTFGSSQTGGRGALGTNLRADLSLHQQQFAAYAPLETFHVSTGSTPGGIRVRGRELIGSATSGSTTLLYGANGTASAQAVILNPSSFPRLQSYSAIYEMYVFHEAKFMFQSNQPTTAGGVAILSVDYDVADTAPASTVAQMRNISSSMSNVYADNACVIKRSLSRLPKYYTASSGSDAVDINQANMFYAFEGVVGVSAAQGYVVVEYDVEFFTPQ